MAKFDNTFCSQCGTEFGPGDSGYSHCDQHLPNETWEALLARNANGDLQAMRELGKRFKSNAPMGPHGPHCGCHYCT